MGVEREAAPAHGAEDRWQLVVEKGRSNGRGGGGATNGANSEGESLRRGLVVRAGESPSEEIELSTRLEGAAEEDAADEIVGEREGKLAEVGGAAAG